MPRLGRIIIPGYPHLVTHRAAARRRLFVSQASVAAYLALLKAATQRLGVRVVAYCLLPDRVHLVLIPLAEPALVRAVQQTHRLYATRLNRRKGRSAPRWAPRPLICALDRAHLPEAVCYVESSPVRCGVARSPWKCTASSAAERVGFAPSTGLLYPVELMVPWRVGRWKELVEEGADEAFVAMLEAHVRRGWPLMAPATLAALERDLGRRLRPLARGRPKKRGAKGAQAATR